MNKHQFINNLQLLSKNSEKFLDDNQNKYIKRIKKTEGKRPPVIFFI